MQTEPLPSIGIEAFESHYMVIAVRPFILADTYWEAYYSCMEDIRSVFQDHNITVAYTEGVDFGLVGKK